MPSASHQQIQALLSWYADSGVLTAETTHPTDLNDWPARGFRLQKQTAREVIPPPRPASTATPITSDDAPLPTDEAVALATHLAQAADSIEALDQIIRDFDGCPLKPGARSTVVYDGIPRAPLLIIGEAPGKDEDRIGKPFVGRAGGLLDKMLAAIDASRLADDGKMDVCISNSIYWRPPGNRTPTKAEVEICLPFVRRFIELSTPKVILLTGNVPTQALYPGVPGITRTRGTWRAWPDGSGKEIPVLPMFHPAFLLRQPAQKRLAWADLLTVKERLTKC